MGLKVHLVSSFLVFPVKIIRDTGLLKGFLWGTLVVGCFYGSNANLGGWGSRRFFSVYMAYSIS